MNKCLDVTFYKNVCQQIIDAKTSFFRFWWIKLIAQFKEQMSDILYILHIKRYIRANPWKVKILGIYAQLLFSYTKIAQMTSIYNQLLIV